MSDPRVFFAAERTLLAWIRTGLTVMGLGFVVARFGMFLALFSSGAGQSAPRSHGPSTALGIVLVLVGVGAILGALQNHRSYLGSIPAEDRPRAAIPVLAPLVAVAIAVAGLGLAAYLGIT